MSESTHNEKIESNTGPRSKDNNQWYCFTPDSDTAIVFVHGYFSSSKACWQSKKGVYWPDLIRGDDRFKRPSIFLGGYYTDVDSGDYKLDDCSAELFAGLNTPQANGHPPPLSIKNIVFICHSLGGIVTRYMLESKAEAFKDKQIGLVLMASPSAGSDYANTLNPLIRFFKNKMGGQLRWNNDVLMDLDRRFRTLLTSRRIPDLVGAEAVEHHALLHFRFLPKFLRPIVEKESAARYFGSYQRLPNTNHSTIVKPDGLEHPSHQFVANFFHNQFLPTIHLKVDTENSQLATKLAHSKETENSQRNVADDVLFDILGPENIQYYLERNSDSAIAKRLNFYSLWVCGPSGCGKTSSVRYLVANQKATPVEVCLAHCTSPVTAQQCLAEILSTLEQVGMRDKQDQPTFNSLISLLAKHTKQNPLILYLDEVPITGDPQSGAELVPFIGNLLTSIKQRTGQSEIRIVISSLTPPAESVMKQQAKMGEQLSVFELGPWTNSELTALLREISTHLSDVRIPDEFIHKLLNECRGSPRFLKTFVKNTLVHAGSESVYEDALARTRDQFI